MWDLSQDLSWHKSCFPRAAVTSFSFLLPWFHQPLSTPEIPHSSHKTSTSFLRSLTPSSCHSERKFKEGDSRNSLYTETSAFLILPALPAHGTETSFLPPWNDSTSMYFSFTEPQQLWPSCMKVTECWTFLLVLRGDCFIHLHRLQPHSLCSPTPSFPPRFSSSAFPLYKGRVLALQVTHNLLLYFHALGYLLVRQG